MIPMRPRLGNVKMDGVDVSGEAARPLRRGRREDALFESSDYETRCAINLPKRWMVARPWFENQNRSCSRSSF